MDAQKEKHCSFLDDGDWRLQMKNNSRQKSLTFWTDLKAEKHSPCRFFKTSDSRAWWSTKKLCLPFPEQNNGPRPSRTELEAVRSKSFNASLVSLNYGPINKKCRIRNFAVIRNWVNWRITIHWRKPHVILNLSCSLLLSVVLVWLERLEPFEIFLHFLFCVLLNGSNTTI